MESWESVMETQTDFDPRTYLQMISEVVEDIQQLEKFARQSVKTLEQQGFQIKLDVEGLNTRIDQQLRYLRQVSHRFAQQLDQYEELARVSALVTSSLDLNEVLEGVMDTVIHLTGAERAYIMLKSQQGDELVVQAARNWNQETLSQDEVTFSRSIIRDVMNTGQPMLTTNAQSDARFQNAASVMLNSLRSIIVIPLMLQGKAVGVLYADNRLHQTVFSQNNVPILTAFANQATIAIENARHFEKVRDDLEEAKRQVKRLQIQVDQNRLKDQVGEITDTDYFQELSTMARKMRNRGEDRK